MKKRKTPWCVRLKDRIQAQINRENRGLTDAQIAKKLHDTLASSPDPIARLWRTARPSAFGPAPRTKRRSA